MIGAAALAEFAGRYPDRPALIDHELSGHPLATLPALRTLIRQMPDGTARLWDERQALFTQSAGPEAASLLEDSAAGDAHFRFLGIEQTEPYGAWSNEIRRYLSPLLLGTSRGLAFTSPLLTVQLTDEESQTRLFAQHALLLLLHGEMALSVKSSHVPETYGPDTHADGAEGLVLNTVPSETGQGDDFNIAEGRALFLPARAPWSARIIRGPAMALVIRWTTQDVLRSEGSARWRGRIGRHPSPARLPWLASLEARLARLFEK